jgi:hypothetical protein
VVIVPAVTDHGLADRVPGLFEPDALLASQYFDRIRRQIEHDGERRLMMAVLEDAVHAYCKTVGATKTRARQDFREAEEWFESRETHWLFSFEVICDVLGLEADYIRRGLREWKARAGRDRGDDEPRGDEPVIRLRRLRPDEAAPTRPAGARR